MLVLQPLRETTAGNVRVPRNVTVLGLMRRDSVSDEFVPNAGDFRPERWLAAESQGQSAGSAKRISMPFGAGPRICPGRYLALLEMKMAMAMLLSHFEIAGVDTPNGAEAAERLSFTMTPVGLSLRLKAR
jgi:cytochrome P450